ncbi:MAG TPA: hypothetical protein VFX50_16720, partial [Gemmatimonadales bacterium]|nr:hypothetical protein [Gemmatimonadales bacterium]
MSVLPPNDSERSRGQRVELEQALARVRTQLGPLSPAPPDRRLGWLLLAAPAAATAVWAVFLAQHGPRADAARLGPLWLTAGTVLGVATAGALLLLSLRLTVPARGLPLATCLAACGAALATHVATAAAFHARSAEAVPAGDEMAVGLFCFRHQLWVAAPALLLALWLHHRGVPQLPARRGLLAATGAGLLANALWTLVCPFTAPAHVWPAHLGVAVVLAIA